MRINVTFHGERNAECDALATAHGATHLGSGVMMVGSHAGEHDIEYEVPDDKAAPVMTALRDAAFTVTVAEPRQ